MVRDTRLDRGPVRWTTPPFPKPRPIRDPNLGLTDLGAGFGVKGVDVLSLLSVSLVDPVRPRHPPSYLRRHQPQRSVRPSHPQRERGWGWGRWVGVLGGRGPCRTLRSRLDLQFLKVRRTSFVGREALSHWFFFGNLRGLRFKGGCTSPRFPFGIQGALGRRFRGFHPTFRGPETKGPNPRVPWLGGRGVWTMGSGVQPRVKCPLFWLWVSRPQAGFP